MLRRNCPPCVSRRIPPGHCRPASSRRNSPLRTGWTPARHRTNRLTARAAARFQQGVPAGREHGRRNGAGGHPHGAVRQSGSMPKWRQTLSAIRAASSGGWRSSPLLIHAASLRAAAPPSVRSPMLASGRDRTASVASYSVVPFAPGSRQTIRQRFGITVLQERLRDRISRLDAWLTTLSAGANQSR